MFSSVTSQFDFSNDDWDHIATTPVLVGFAVAKAEDSGFFGSMREAKALSDSIAAGLEDDPALGLISQASATETKDMADAFKTMSAEVLADTAVAACHDLSAILSATAGPDEAAGFKKWVFSVADTVARAAKEHGVRVSPGEAALIERIGVALAIS